MLHKLLLAILTTILLLAMASAGENSRETAAGMGRL